MAKSNGGTVTLRLKLEEAGDVRSALNEIGPLGKKALSALEEAANGASTATGFTRMQMMELAHVSRSAFDAIAAGASPVRVLMMEGGRLSQALSSGPGGLAGGFKALAEFINPTTLGIVAFAAALGGIVVLEQQYEGQHRALVNALAGTGASTGITVQSLERISEAVAKAGGGTIAFAQDAEKAFIGIRGMTEANLGAAVGVLQDFAARTGQDTKAATQDLAKALENPIEGFQKLNRELGFLTPKQVEAIEHFQNLGDYAKASAIGLEALKTNVAGAHDELSGLGKLLEDISNGFANSATNAGKFFYSLTHKTAPPIAGMDPIAALVYRTLAGSDPQGAPGAGQQSADNKQGQIITDAIAKYSTVKRRGELTGLIAQLEAQLASPTNQNDPAAIRSAIEGARRELKGLDRKEAGPAVRNWAGTELSAADKADKILADARFAAAESIQARTAAEKQKIEADAKSQLDEIQKNLKDDPNKAAKTATLQKAQAEIEAAKQIRLGAADEKQRRELAAAKLSLDQDELATYRQSQAYRLTQVATQAERLEIALETLDAEKKVELEAAQEALRVAQRGGVEGDISAARTRIDNINSRYATRRLQANDQYQGPLSAYMGTLDKANASIGEALENTAVNGMKNLNDGIVAAITNSKKLGDAFKGVAQGIIADLARIAVQKYITAPLGDLLFGGKGSIASSVASFFTPHAAGGFAQGWSLVGERGPELVNFDRPGQVYTNDFLKSLTQTSAGAQAASQRMNAGPQVQLGATYYTINAQGADPAQLMRVQQSLDEHRRREPERFVQYFKAIKKAGG